MELDFTATAKPFALVVLCCTGIDHDDRNVIMNQATQMGAIFKADLRSDVTHLVVGNVDTPKYQYAAQNRFDLKIMDMNWVKEAFEKWVQGEDVNFEAMVAAHILPPLYGLHICITNIEAQEDRKLIETQIQSSGGTYHPDLSRQCTHLICGSTAGKKYEAALKWSIHCVGIEWLHQSIERGMSLEAKYFTFDIEPGKRGEGAWDRNAALKATGQSGPLGPSLDSEVPVDFDNGVRRRRLRKAGSRIAQEGIWEGILGGVSEGPSEHHLIPQPSTAQDPYIEQFPVTEVSGMDDYELQFGGEPRALFDGLTFYISGFTEKKGEILADVISKNGGLVFAKVRPGPENASHSTYTIIPHTCPREEVPMDCEDTEIVTEMWIERCMVANTTFNPRELIMCTPMPGPFPRPFFKDLAVSISGFSGPDLLHVEKLLSLLGADYYDALTRKRSLLLIQDGASGPKIAKAKQWGIPVVKVGWLWAVISQGEGPVDIAPWSENSKELSRYTGEEASSCVKPFGVKASASYRGANSERQPILDGCRIYVSKKLEDMAPELNAIAEHLGAEITPNFDIKVVTHLIHQSTRASETFREFRLARSSNIPVVHPQWLFECRSQGKRCTESGWPWTWDADKNLAVLGGESNSAPEARRDKRIRKDENTPPEQNSCPVEPIKMEHLAKLLGTVSSPQKRVKRKLTGRARDTQITNTTTSMKSSENAFENVQEYEAPRATQEKVEYKDPIAEREMAKLIASLQGITEGERIAKSQTNGVTPAEDSWRTGGRRKSTRK